MTAKPMRIAFVALIALLAALPAAGHSGEVVAAKVTPLGGGAYRLAATIRHGDTGWGHFINGFEVLTPDGRLLVRRVLYHPHVDEQPFTRSSARFIVPAGVTSVTVRLTHLRKSGANAKATVTRPPARLSVVLPDRR